MNITKIETTKFLRKQLASCHCSISFKDTIETVGILIPWRALHFVSSGVKRKRVTCEFESRNPILLPVQSVGQNTCVYVWSFLS